MTSPIIASDLENKLKERLITFTSNKNNKNSEKATKNSKKMIKKRAVESNKKALLIKLFIISGKKLVQVSSI